MSEEVEITQGRDKDYEIVPITPIRRLEKRMGELEQAGTIPQLQSLISQIISLIRGNQRVVEEIVKANSDLRNELSKLPPKIDELTTTMKSFLNMVKAAGEEELKAPSPETMRPIEESFKQLLEQNKKLIEGNQAILDSMDKMGRKMKSGTPVSQILQQYPGLRRNQGENR